MEGQYNIADEKNGANQLSLCGSTKEIIATLEKLMRKNPPSINIIRDSLIKASRLAVKFDDFRSLYLFSFFSVFPKVWPDFKWVDSLMETAIKYTSSENQLFVLLKDAALMGKSNISKKIKPKLELTDAHALQTSAPSAVYW